MRKNEKEKKDRNELGKWCEEGEEDKKKRRRKKEAGIEGEKEEDTG